MNGLGESSCELKKFRCGASASVGQHEGMPTGERYPVWIARPPRESCALDEPSSVHLGRAIVLPGHRGCHFVAA